MESKIYAYEFKKTYWTYPNGLSYQPSSKDPWKTLKDKISHTSRQNFREAMECNSHEPHFNFCSRTFSISNRRATHEESIDPSYSWKWPKQNDMQPAIGCLQILSDRPQVSLSVASVLFYIFSLICKNH